MLRVQNFLRFLDDLPQQSSDPAALALKAHLALFKDANQELTAQDVQAFFNDALVFEYWLHRATELEQRIYKLLTLFVKSYSSQFDFDAIHWPSQMQIIKLQCNHDVRDVLQAFLHREFADQDCYRVIPLANGEALAVIRGVDKNIEVRQFDNCFVIRRGHLEPLRNHLRLHYTSQLQLNPECRHRFKADPFLNIVLNGSSYGLIVRGYTFQKYYQFENEDISKHTPIYYALKRLESHFVNNASDPFYKQLVVQLERACRLLRLKDQSALNQAPHLLSRAESILESVYCEDKMLNLHVRELRLLLEDLKVDSSHERFAHGHLDKTHPS